MFSLNESVEREFLVWRSWNSFLLGRLSVGGALEGKARYTPYRVRSIMKSFFMGFSREEKDDSAPFGAFLIVSRGKTAENMLAITAFNPNIDPFLIAKSVFAIKQGRTSKDDGIFSLFLGSTTLHGPHALLLTVRLEGIAIA